MSESVTYFKIPIELMRNVLDSPRDTRLEILDYFATQYNSPTAFMYDYEIIYRNQWREIDGDIYDCAWLQDEDIKEKDELCNKSPIHQKCIEEEEKEHCEKCKKYAETHDVKYISQFEDDIDLCGTCEYKTECDEKSKFELQELPILPFKKAQERGRKVSIGVHFSGCIVQVSSHMFFDGSLFDDSTNVWTRACALAYISLGSIIGTKKYCKTNSRLMFARMAGYSVFSDIDFDELGVIKGYIINERKMSAYSERLRLDVMSMFDNIHIYAEKGKRGFVLSKSNNDRLESFKAMKKWGDNSSKKSKRNNIVELMRQAKKES